MPSPISCLFRQTRVLSEFYQQSFADVSPAAHELDLGSPAMVESAFRLGPTLPLVHLGLAACEKDPARADLLRRYELQCLRIKEKSRPDAR